MRWTNVVQKIAKVALVIVIIASVVTGFIFMGFDDDDMLILGLCIIPGGVLTSFVSYAFIMLVCEMSTNIYNGYAVSTHIYNQSKSSKENDTAKSSTLEQSKAPNDSWVCKCGKRNSNSSDTCANCNRKRES